MKAQEYQGLKTWKFATHKVTEDGHGNYDVIGADGETIACIVTDDRENLEADLNAEQIGVDGWEDGGGQVISIPERYAMVLAELESLDEEARNSLMNWYYEPTSETVRCEGAGMDYEGNDEEAFYFLQTEGGEIL